VKVAEANVVPLVCRGCDHRRGPIGVRHEGDLVFLTHPDGKDKHWWTHPAFIVPIDAPPGWRPPNYNEKRGGGLWQYPWSSIRDSETGGHVYTIEHRSKKCGHKLDWSSRAIARQLSSRPGGPLIL
jgi:hypothetical protein